MAGCSSTPPTRRRRVARSAPMPTAWDELYAMTAPCRRARLPDAHRAAARPRCDAPPRRRRRRRGATSSSARSASSSSGPSRDDTVRGIVLTDALIGTFTSAHDPDLLANRCFLYHVVGGGTGHWDVPVGGMGTVADQLATAAAKRGAELVTGVEVTSIETDGTTATVATARRSPPRGPAGGRQRRARRARPPARRGADGAAPRGGAGEGQHAAGPAPAPARPRGRPGAGVRRDVPRQRGLRPARAGLPPGRAPARCPTSSRARSTATR